MKCIQKHQSKLNNVTGFQLNKAGSKKEIKKIKFNENALPCVNKHESHTNNRHPRLGILPLDSWALFQQVINEGWH